MISKTTVFATFFIFAAFLEALPTGAPLNACQTMLPRHNAEPIDTDNPPYEIVYSIVNNSTLKVTLQSKDEEKSFRGFLMQARPKWESEAIGKWSTKEPNTKTIDCFDREDTAVTHDHKQNSVSRKNGFKKLTFEWTCSKETSLDGLILIATIAETSKVIYANVSNVVHVEKPKVEPSISFDDFAEIPAVADRDEIDLDHPKKKQENNSARKFEMDLEREGSVELDNLNNVQRKIGKSDKQNMERVNSFDREEDEEEKSMENRNFISLEEPIRPKIMNDEEIEDNQNSRLKSINKKKIMSQEIAQQKDMMSLDEDEMSPIREKNVETKPVNDLKDNNRKLVSAKDLFENNNEQKNVVEEAKLDDVKIEEIKRLQAQIKVLQLKLKKVIDNN